MTATHTIPTPLPEPRHLHRPNRAHKFLSLCASARVRVDGIACRFSSPALRISLALIMLWFGIPKLFFGMSPAQDLAERTIALLTGGLISGDTARFSIAGIEIGLGIALLVGQHMRFVATFGVLHLAGTAMPLVLFPAETWAQPFVGTLEGQYILKNLVLLAVYIALYAKASEPMKDN